MIKAIDTVYKGYKFRSRLEARWAVFFETCGLKWKYEDEGYEINGKRYLPDFVLEDKIFVEIKADGSVNGKELCSELSAETGMNVLHISGQPYRNSYTAWLYSTHDGGDYGEAEFAGCRRCNGVWIAGPPIIEDQQGHMYFWAVGLFCDEGCTADAADRPPHPTYGILPKAYETARSARFEFIKGAK